MTDKKSEDNSTGSKHPVHADVGTGNFPPAVESHGLTLTAAIGGTDETGKVISRLSLEQAQRAFENLQTVLEANGQGMEDVLRCTVYLTDMRDIIYVDRAMERIFSGTLPAVSIVQVQGLRDEQKVAVEAVAVRRGAEKDIVDFMG